MIWDITALLIHSFSLWLCPFLLAFIEDDTFSEALLLIIIHIILDIMIHLNRPIMV